MSRGAASRSGHFSPKAENRSGRKAGFGFLSPLPHLPTLSHGTSLPQLLLGSVLGGFGRGDQGTFSTRSSFTPARGGPSASRGVAGGRIPCSCPCFLTGPCPETPEDTGEMQHLIRQICWKPEILLPGGAALQGPPTLGVLRVAW